MQLVLGSANLDTPYGFRSENFLSVDDFSALAANAKELSIVAIDTSPSYGHAEQIISRVADQGTFVFTKLSFGKVTNPFTESELSHQKFGLVHLIHNWEDLDANSKFIGWNSLQEANHNGLNIGFGFSTYFDLSIPNNLTRKTEFYLQAPMSCLNQMNIEGLKKLKREFPKAKIVARSIFLQGLLTTEPSQTTLSKFKDLNKFFSKRNQMRLTSLELCLRFIKDQEFIDMVLLGVNSYDQMIEITETLERIEHNQYQIDWSYFASEDIELIDPRRWT